MVFCILFFLPLLVLGGAYLLWKEVTPKEALLHTVIQAVVAGISALIVYHSTVGDVEVWNGKVTDKKREEVSCSHSYSCNCSKDSKGNESCSTCYEHSNDYDWEVHTTNGETIEIARVDSQGSRQPPRWSQVQIGEPTAVPHRYTNYIKGSPDSLFRRQGLVEKYKGTLPEYPEVYDYYRFNALVLAGYGNTNSKAWNEALSQVNTELGASKQVNMMVVLTDEPSEWFHALEESWIGGKKNDVVLVIGVKDKKPVWASVMAWARDDIFKIKLRDEVMGLEEVTPELVVPVLRKNVDIWYERKPMKDFEYLSASITPSTTQWVVSLILGLIISVAMAVIMHKVRARRHYAFGSYREYQRGRRGPNVHGF